MNSMFSMIERMKVYKPEAKRMEAGLKIGQAVARHTYKRDAVSGLYRREDGAWFRYDPVCDRDGANVCGMVPVTVGADGSIDADLQAARDWDGLTPESIAAQVKDARAGKEVHTRREMARRARQAKAAKEGAGEAQGRKVLEFVPAVVTKAGKALRVSKESRRDWVQAAEVARRMRRGSGFAGVVVIAHGFAAAK